MEVVVLQNQTEIGRVAADAVTALLDRKPDAVLGLATGSSPLPIYDELAARHAAGTLSFRQARGFTSTNTSVCLPITPSATAT